MKTYYKQFIIIICLFLPVYACLSLPAAAASKKCSHYLIYKSGKFQTWGLVTPRLTEEISRDLRVANKAETLQGTSGNLPKFNSAAILKGKKTLLSLGEGASNFIYSILNFQFKNRLPLQAYAADMVYKDLQAFYDDAVIFEIKDFRKIQRFQKKFPNHYIGAYFQDMQIRDKNGEPLLFNEIVSSNSVVYLLARFNKIQTPTAQEIAQARVNDKQLLTAIVQNLKPGGVFRLWPYLPGLTNGHIRWAYIKDLLDELQSEGVIHNHNVTAKNQAEEESKIYSHSFLILQR